MPEGMLILPSWNEVAYLFMYMYDKKEADYFPPRDVFT